MIAGGVAFIFMLGLAFLGMPISFTLFLVGFVGIVAIKTLSVANALLALTPLATILVSDMAALPLFILLGAFALASGVAADGYEVARRWVGRLPGGIALATTLASAGFAACCGSSIAAAATMGKMAIPEMKKAGYSDALASGTCAGGGLLATMIPPSGAMVIYGIAAEQPIGRLLIAGVIPGLLLTFSFLVVLYTVGKLLPASAPLSVTSFTWKERLVGMPRLWGIAVIFLTIFLGIFLGFFTASEAAAFGCFVALLLLISRRGIGSWQAFVVACRECATLSSTLLFLVFGALVFGRFIVVAGLPRELTNFITGLSLPPMAVVFAMLLSYVVLGMFLDGVAMMLITIPIFLPVLQSLGYSGIWFGVIVVGMVEVGMLTPPFGLVVFVINGVAPDMSLADIFKGSLLFVGAEVLVLALIAVFPQLALWLPSLM